MSTRPADPTPDDKDWTWVLERVCPDCGFDAGAVAREDIAGRLVATTPRWQQALRRPDAAVRPSPQVWSVLEYGCHIRDVHALFGLRGRLMLDEVDPGFANWDQDETAVRNRYWEADPALVAVEIEQEAGKAACVFSGLTGGQWSRTGRRSNGSVFTTETLGRYYLHDVEHHLHDVW